MGRKLSACCEEGLVYTNAEEYGRRKIERDAYDLLERFFCWGENHARDMVQTLRAATATRSSSPAIHVSICTGPIFGRSSPTGWSGSERKYGPYILITTKFSQHNGYFSKDAALEKMKALGKVQNTEQEEEARGQMEFHRAGFMGFMEAIDEISRQLSRSHHHCSPAPLRAPRSVEGQGGDTHECRGAVRGQCRRMDPRRGTC